MKTSELTGKALDLMVLVALGRNVNLLTPEGQRTLRLHNFSTNWGLAGPIIERERINVDPAPDCAEWYSYYDNHGKWHGADAPLIAAMRCYVAAKLGDEVNVPEELT